MKHGKALPLSFATTLLSTAAIACGLALLALPVTAAEPHSATHAAAAHPSPAGAVSPATALERLKEGNARFVAGKPSHPRASAERRAGLTSGQQPFAVILGCSDSRVPAELLFDQGFGDMFVIRVAGNVAETDERGSIEYAVEHLHAPLIVVLGHEQCGAVTAALSSPSDRAKETEAIQALLKHVAPSLKDIPAGLKEGERVHLGVEANVRHAMQKLAEAPALRDKVSRGELKLVGAVYELNSGKVRWLAEDGSTAPASTSH